MHNHESVHTQMYRGFKLKMFHDHANDPYHYMDGLWPMLVFGSRYRAEKNDATEAFEITDEQFEANRKSLEVFNSPDGFLDHAMSCYKSSQWNEVEELLEWAEIPHLRISSSGYYQGDRLEMIVVWTPSFEAATGITREYAMSDEGKEDMKSSVLFWAAWAYGDVFRYEIEGVDESCGGFIETDPFPYEKTYCMQDAMRVVDRHINKKRTEHQKQLKTWIRNKVPVLYRKATDPRLTNTQVIS